MPRTATPSSRSSSSREARAKEKARADRNHDAYVSRTYGLERGEYARKLAEQDGRCAICTRRPRARRLAVDHDHQTGLVRGLLCYTCNKFVLGFIEFDPIAAHNASVYIANIARDFGDLYDPDANVRGALVEPIRAAGQRRVQVPSTRPEDDLPF